MKIFILLYFFVCITILYGDELADRRNNFIYGGFGFQYSDDEAEDIDLFLARHGKPLNIYEKDEKNVWGDVRDEWGEIINKEITLEYETIFVNFSKYRAWGNNFYQTLLTTIESKDNIDYLYGIKHGLTFNELENIIGEIKFWHDAVSVMLIGWYDSGVQIWFYENKIERIEWRYLVQ
jgi:hypothetical protein